MRETFKTDTMGVPQAVDDLGNLFNDGRLLFSGPNFLVDDASGGDTPNIAGILYTWIAWTD